MRNDAGAIDGLRFDLLGARQFVALGPRYTVGKQLGDVLRDNVPVLGVHHRDRTELLARLEHLVQLGVVQLVQALVGHEALERVDAALLAQYLHLVPHRLRPPGDTDVQPIIAHHLRVGPDTPGIVRLEQRFALLGQHKVHCKETGTRPNEVQVED